MSLAAEDPPAARAANPSDQVTAVLSHGQERMWFLDRLAGGDSSYNMVVAVRLRGPLDQAALARALTEFTARHESMRTVFPEVDGIPVAVVRPAAPIVIELVELPGESGDRLDALVAERTNAPFDLARGPLCKVSLIRLGVDHHVLVMVMHHIIGDAWSVEQIMFPQLNELYTAFAAKKAAPARQAPRYRDHAVAQRERDHSGHLAFWSAELAGVPSLELPIDRPRPAVRGGQGAMAIRRIPLEVWTRVTELARAERCTPFMVLMAAYQVLLQRHSGQDEFCVGTPIAGRDEEELEAVFGLFINTLAVRADLVGDPPVRELLKRVRKRLLRGFGNAAVPFEQVVGELGVDRDPAIPPVFQTMLMLGNPDGEPLRLGETVGEAVFSGLASARFDLALDVVVYPDALQLLFTYSTEVFEPATVERLAGHLERLLREVAARPEARLSELAMLPPEETALLLPGGPAPDAVVPYLGLDELIAAQVRREPGADAVVTPAGVMSYLELDARAEALANGLAARGVRAGQRVALCLKASPEAIVAVLGTLKAGATYVPLDPAQPTERLGALLADCEAALVVVPDESQVSLPVGTPVAGVGELCAHAGAPRPEKESGAPAYVIYTSGSTGAPKGVVVGHDTVARLATAFVDLHGFGPGQRVLMVPPLSFDASAGDLYPALVSGAAIVLHPDPVALTGQELLRLCAEQAITMVDAPSALWQQWVDDLAGLEVVDPGPLATVMVGGESIPVDRLRTWARLTGGRLAFYNHYGPTEATVCATVYQTVDGSELGDRTHLPIGSALPHVRAYVLDGRGGLAPIGVPGELHLGGPCLALGYLGLPELTAERFLPDPFSPEPDARMYATGDLAKRRADGQLEFLGRADRQLKINAVRIEPAEVEAACLARTGVREAVVTAVDGRLVAYLVGEPVTRAELRAFLAARLPAAMVPQAVVMLDSLPLTPHGKIDYRALPAPEAEAVPYENPRTPTERAIAAVWEEALGAAAGRRDNFFDLGGHSLLTPKIVNRIAAVTGVAVELGVFFAAADLAELAARVDGHVQEAARPDLRGDATLPDDLLMSGGPVPATPPRRVLLTGATGFLGAYLLADLLSDPDAVVHCLVRGESPVKRVRGNLERYGLWRDAFEARIVPEAGDLAARGLGLPPGRLDELADTLDLIVHSGGLVDFARPYGRLRPANVEGTLEILRLAAHGALTTPVHLVSTLGVHLTPGERTVRESDPLPDPDRLHPGYDQSKWVADRLAEAAREAGLPVTIHRPARISGDTRTGACPPDDFLGRFFATCVSIGSVPDGENLDLAPVDHVAAAIGHLARARVTGDFHYYNPRTLTSPELVEGLRANGFPVRLVPGARWRAEVRERLAAGEPLPVAAFPRFFAEYGDAKGPVFDCTATERTLAAAGLACPPATALLDGHLGHLIATGVLVGAADSKESHE
ncbi:amino acid adenylation domain-containing protein [Nonomuraea sp. NPDC046570]|uniref:non-ribosomal peptide synthetase n=1 Tax=Nonomuraea sp. NPDC046570 TaxID=3155255 RepID=UPI0033E8CE4B